MSTVSSTIRVNDGMSSAFRSINKALSMVLNNFETLQSVSSNSIDTSNIAEARAELTKASAAVTQLDSELGKAGQEQGQYTREVRNSSSAMEGLTRKAIGLVGAYASLQSIMSLANLSDQLTQAESRLKLIVDGTGESVDQLTSKIMDSANRSRSAYLDTAKAVASFSQRAGGAFKNNDEVIAFTETLNKMYVVAGASAQEQSSSMLQLTQALGSGVLRGEEFNAVFEAAPNIMQSVADYMDVPIGQLRNMAAEGQITADILKNAVFNAADQVNEDFNSMSKTWSQTMTLIKNKSIRALTPVLKKLNELANSEYVENFANRAISAMSIMIDYLMYAFNILSAIAEFTDSNWSVIEPVVLTVAAAIGLYTIALMANTIAQTINSGITAFAALQSSVRAAALMLESGATFAATAAQYGFNAALLACPLTWIILLIIVIIGAFYLLAAIISKVSEVAISGTGLILSVLFTAAAIVYNVFTGIYNMIVEIFAALFNQVIAFIEFFANVWSDPLGSIVRLFAAMASSVLGLLAAIASAIDSIFGSNLAGAVHGWQDGLQSAVESKFGTGKTQIMKMDPADTKLKRITYESAVNTAMNIGGGVDSYFKGISSNLGGGASGIDTSKLGADVGDIAGNTGSMADAMDITSEDLKYLRDIAEQEIINRFTTASVNVEFGGITNNVNSDMDLDGVVEYIATKTTEAMDIAAEGVHQ